jgi:hypothetical protein
MKQLKKNAHQKHNFSSIQERNMLLTYTTVMRDAVSPYMDLSRPVMRPLFCGKLRMFPAMATVSNHDEPLLQMKQ